MSRKPTAKPSAHKNHAKKPMAKSKTFLSEKMEKDFREIPTKIAAQYKNDLTVLKKQESKLKEDLKKAQLNNKLLKKKAAELTSSKSTSASAKKALVTSKKALDTSNKTIKDLTEQLSKLKLNHNLLSNNHKKFTLITKQLSQLDKQFKASLTPQRKVTSKKTPSRKKGRAESSPAISVDEVNSTSKPESFEVA